MPHHPGARGRSRWDTSARPALSHRARRPVSAKASISRPTQRWSRFCPAVKHCCSTSLSRPRAATSGSRAERGPLPGRGADPLRRRPHGVLYTFASRATASTRGERSLPGADRQRRRDDAAQCADERIALVREEADQPASSAGRASHQFFQRYADFFESAADGMVVVDHAGRILFSNPRASEITRLFQRGAGRRRRAALPEPQGDRPRREHRARLSLRRVPARRGHSLRPRVGARGARAPNELDAERHLQPGAARRTRRAVHLSRRHAGARHGGRAAAHDRVSGARDRQLGRRHRLGRPDAAAC